MYYFVIFIVTFRVLIVYGICYFEGINIFLVIFFVLLCLIMTQKLLFSVRVLNSSVVFLSSLNSVVMHTFLLLLSII